MMGPIKYINAFNYIISNYIQYNISVVYNFYILLECSKYIILLWYLSSNKCKNFNNNKKKYGLETSWVIITLLIPIHYVTKKYFQKTYIKV